MIADARALVDPLAATEVTDQEWNDTLAALVHPLQREVPLGRPVDAHEDAAFAAYLCSDAVNCFVGQVFPVCSGWVNRQLPSM